MTAHPWTDAEKDCLRELWGTEKTAGLAQLFPGRSRNAIIGCAHRLGLPKLAKKDPARPAPGPRPKRVRAKPRVKLPPEESPMPGQIPFARAAIAPLGRRLPRWRPLLQCGAGDCHWPEEVENLQKTADRFCCAPVVAGRSYCEEHCKRAFGRTPAATGRPFVLGRAA